MKEIKIELHLHPEKRHPSCSIAYNNKMIEFELFEPGIIYMFKSIEIGINKIINE